MDNPKMAEISLRDYIAIQVLPHVIRTENEQLTAEWAYRHADAMLKVRKQNEQ